MRPLDCPFRPGASRGLWSWSVARASSVPAEVRDRFACRRPQRQHRSHDDDGPFVTFVGKRKGHNLAIKVGTDRAEIAKGRELAAVLNTDRGDRPVSSISDEVARGPKFADCLPAEISVGIAAARVSDLETKTRTASEPVISPYPASRGRPRRGPGWTVRRSGMATVDPSLLLLQPFDQVGRNSRGICDEALARGGLHPLRADRGFGARPSDLEE